MVQITKTKMIGSRTFTVKCDESLEKQGEFLLNLFRDTEEKAGLLEDGMKIQVGWSILFVHELDRDNVEILAPDYTTNPFARTTDDLSATLSVQLAQNQVLKMTGATGETVLFQDTLVSSEQALAADRVYLERTDHREDGRSGWYLGPVEGQVEQEDLRLYYVFQLFNTHPGVLKMLLLPKGYVAVLNDGDVEAVLDPEDRNVWPTG
ncbi:immunity protein Imm33 domain-containing protein [Saccharibacillus kuerlensis]|uniref:Imm33-like domain-containing protein n=1 Tax=Saccharibacillus kuerlensis TaxID=459527 RepID=A0ABQ2L5N7_9BACL|nr:hypothetical protein [Saccharibacillus kuerlensis]GGO04319.1 hypothetical protein GCM10010969_29430 [Saccharibacillus kuerlensis]